MKRQDVKLSIRISHPRRDLSSVCTTLGLRPTNIWKKGDERRSPKGNEIGGLREDSRCSIELKSTPGASLSRQIEAGLDLLKPHRTTLLRLSAGGGTISFYVGWFCDENIGETLNAQILEGMARLRISLELNIYLPDPPASETIKRKTPSVGSNRDRRRRPMA
ncbi:MAG: DUF4279 domain-containing protein [Bradyrhizobium sp.]